MNEPPGPSLHQEDDSYQAPSLTLYADDAAAIDDLFRAALKRQGNSAFSELLDFGSQFRRQSLFNAMLIQVQRPGARAVASRRQWLSIDRKVNPDAVPIIILRPFGPIDFVYEIGDTSGGPLPGQGDDPLLALGKAPPLMWENTVLTAAKSGISVELTDNYGSGLAGTAAVLHDSQHARTESMTAQYSWRVRINSRLDEASRFATLAHELAHIYCGHLGAAKHRLWPNRRGKLSSGQQELEAEAAAWMVCQRGGIETRSVEYLSMHVQESDLQHISMFAIFSAAHRIEARGFRRKLK